ncbi:MAG: hypothetical protein WBA46_00165 [Thermomicrobiales bacterium]
MNDERGPITTCPDCGAPILTISTEFGSRKEIDPEPATKGKRPWVMIRTWDFAANEHRPRLTAFSRQMHDPSRPRYSEHRHTCPGRPQP